MKMSFIFISLLFHLIYLLHTMQHKMNFIVLTINFLITQMQHDKISQLFFKTLFSNYNYKVVILFKINNLAIIITSDCNQNA